MQHKKQIIGLIVIQTSRVSVAGLSLAMSMNSERTSGLRTYFPVHILLMESRKAT